ncbi:MAG: hypothetical protein H0U80_03110 [Solirubrobacterales bacterium]|nr:hypothetical protein [Solirubrobacterales bacterium]
MLYSLLGRLAWRIAKRRMRSRRPSRRQSLFAALVTAGGVLASYRAQARKRSSRR